MSRPGASLRMNCPAALMTFELKLPHSPRSAVMTISSGLPVPCAGMRSSGCASWSTRDTRPLSTFSIRWANGRAAMTRSCARLRREAAIIFIAFVICCVDLTARIRRRRSISDGMLLRGRGGGDGAALNCSPNSVSADSSAVLDLVVQDLLLGDRRQHARMRASRGSDTAPPRIGGGPRPALDRGSPSSRRR